MENVSAFSKILWKITTILEIIIWMMILISTNGILLEDINLIGKR